MEQQLSIGFYSSSLSKGGLELNMLRYARYLKNEALRVVIFCVQDSPIHQIALQEGFEIVEQTLDKATTVKIAKEIAALTDLNSFTFECNTIVDEESVCALLQNLKNFERLENINVRQNKFTQRIMDALCDGIKHKKELRVSI